MKKIFLLVFVLATWVSLIAQNTSTIDSLLATYPNQQNEERVTSLNTLAKELLYTYPDSAYAFAIDAFSLARKIKFDYGFGHVSHKLGIYHIQKNHNDSSQYYFETALNMGRKVKDEELVFNSLSGLSNVYQNELKYDSAALMLNQALEIAQQRESDEYLANVYSFLAQLQLQQGYSDTAIALYYYANKYYENSGNKRDQAILLNNIGTVFIQNGEYSKALPLVIEAAEICNQNNYITDWIVFMGNVANCYRKTDSVQKAQMILEEILWIENKEGLIAEQARTYLSLGNVMTSMNKYKEADLFYDSSMVICQDLGIAYGVLLNEISKGQLYVEMANYELAIEFLLKSMVKVDQFGLIHEKLEVLEGLCSAYKGNEQYDKALHYKEQWIAYADSIDNEDTQYRLNELEGKYHKEKSLKEIASLNEKLSLAKATQRYYSLGAIILLLLMVIYWLIRNFKNKKKEIVNQCIKKEKERLEKDLHVKEKELTTNALHAVRINDLTFSAARKIRDVADHVAHKNKKVLLDVVHDLEIAAPIEAWKEFETRFENVHQDFYDRLNELHPELTPGEIRICSFIRLNMTSKDIASLTNRSIRTIESARNSIRKKIGLELDQSLSKYLLSL